MKRSLDGGGAAISLMIAWLVLFGSLMPGCGISFKTPTAQIITQEVTQSTGYLIGKKYPEFGKELLEYTMDFLNQKGKELVNYQYWKEYVAGSLVKDEFLRLKFKRILSLVDMDLKLKAPIEQEEIIRDLWEEFVSGLEVGINAE